MKTYHFDPHNYNQNVLPCLLVIKEEEKYLIWEKRISKELDVDLVVIKYKELEIEEFYLFDENLKIYRHHEERWILPLLKLIQKIKIDQLEEINPQQYLTHENPCLRKIIKEVINA